MSKLIQDYTFYEKYHRHPLNKFIHVLCIPAICWSLFIFLNYIPFSFSFFDNIIDNSYLNMACSLSLKPNFILYISYIIYYVWLSPCLGIASSIFYFIILLLANIFYCNIEHAWIYAIIVQIFSWILQILSHKFIEHNSPAFMSGFIQSFLTAPLFIVLEILVFFKCHKNIRIINNDGYYYVKDSSSASL